MKKVLFLTGTRADYGKLKSLINTVEHSEEFEAYIYVTGMHMLNRYGYTAQEVIKDGYRNIYMNINQHVGDHMEIALANTVQGLSHYVHELKPDLLIIHGDRLEALAGAIVGAFTNTLVGHIEGGELSGTIDDSIRHSVSKMAHIHFVCNDDASQRLIAMGENKNSIFLIGSPDYDVMFNQKLPSLSGVKEYYEIDFDEFGIVLFHPVTTDSVSFESYSDNLVKAINKSKKNFIVVYPNNDDGSEFIIKSYSGFDNDRVKVYPSLSFERFLVLLKNCKMIIGNSSAGIREAPCYGIPTINIGDRQNKRLKHKTIIDVGYSCEEIKKAIVDNWDSDYSDNSVNAFGDGKASIRFLEALKQEEFWDTPIQKVVFDD
jgi:UDP-N-acetylglucosamine 2-epimerase (hydrolysing)